MAYFEAETNEKYVPYIIEFTYSLDRLVLAILFENLMEEELENGDSRQILKIKTTLATIKVNVLPLVKKNIRKRLMRFMLNYQNIRWYHMMIQKISESATEEVMQSERY